MFLILLLLVVACFYPKIFVEKYENTEELPLKSINMCGRNLVFPYYGKMRLLASYRAELDLSLSTRPGGKCNINSIPNYNPTFATLHEDGIFYKLKKSCIMLPIKPIKNMLSYTINSNQSEFTITLALDDQSIVEALSRFLLTNPLYVEFDIESNMSVAYKLLSVSSNDVRRPQSITFSNDIVSGKDQIVSLVFGILLPLQTICDSAFNYISYGVNYVVTDAMLQNAFTQKELNMYVYYLDVLPSNFQNIGQSLQISDENDNVATLFDPAYNTYISNPRKMQSYEFMKMFVIMYNNRMFPVLTYRFDILTTFNTAGMLKRLDTEKVILKCIMTNGYNSSLGLDNCKNNFLQVSMKDAGDYMMIKSSTGNNTDCGPSTSVLIPYYQENTIFSVSLTIGLTESIMYVEWMDTRKKYVYSRTMSCLTDTPCEVITKDRLSDINNLSRMFLSKEKLDAYSLAPILLTWNKDFVYDIKDVAFGYKNLVKDFLS